MNGVITVKKNKINDYIHCTQRTLALIIPADDKL